MTVRPDGEARAYESAELLGGGRKRIERLVASCFADDAGRRYLQVEAGTDGLGPTYRLYAALEHGGERHGAPDDTPCEEVVLVPDTGIGLYDDWEDDQGVPWAFPLEPMHHLAAPATS